MNESLATKARKRSISPLRASRISVWVSVLKQPLAVLMSADLAHVSREISPLVQVTTIEAHASGYTHTRYFHW
jgi:hypothetical protein